MFYPANFAWDEEGKAYCITFRDIPEAITQGDTEEEALFMAQDALTTALDFYFDGRRQVPMPSRPRKGERLIALPASVWAKALLLNELLASNISNAELARRMGTRPQDVQRIVELKHATKIDTIARALSCLGKRLEIRLAER
ncbi:MAG: type II toxin-antitoxin system HicB family antitoxin [Zoogloeaceae bacterium]|jgi:antitoxin HicB|nr:type II toxin-antitoxin system HicB family antitoxin [Zoogloeaceae bacterium]